MGTVNAKQPLVRPRDLLGTVETCKLLGISRETLWYHRKHHGFPQPLTVLSSRPIWDRPSVKAWQAARENTRQKPMLDCLYAYRASGGNVTAAARHAGVDRTTATRWLKSLDEVMPRDRA